MMILIRDVFLGLKKALIIFLVQVILSGILAGFIYVRSDSFKQRWHSYIVNSLENKGLYVAFNNLGLSWNGTLIAKDLSLYQDVDKSQLLVNLNEVLIAIDWLSVLQNENLQLKRIQLVDAQVLLPKTQAALILKSINFIDSKAEDQVIIHSLNAQLNWQNDMLLLNHIEANFLGFKLKLGGVLGLQKNKSSQAAAPTARNFNNDWWIRYENELNKIQHWVKQFREIQFTRAPHLKIELYGNLSELSDLQIDIKMNSADFVYHGHHLKKLDLAMHYKKSRFELSQLSIFDEKGVFKMSAAFQKESGLIDFQASSTLDFLPLVGIWSQSESLREWVCYEPPKLEVSGAFDWQKILDQQYQYAGEMLVKCSLGKFNSRGVIFNGLDFQMILKDSTCYCRDIRLHHKSGQLTGKFFWNGKDDFKYDARVQLDPHVALPFAKMQLTRDIINRFKFNSKSVIDVQINGAGPFPDLQLCHNQGHGEILNFNYRDVDLDKLSADFEFKQRTQLYRNLEVLRPEGKAVAALVQINEDVHTVELQQVVSNMDPVLITSCFAKQTAEHIKRYQMPNTTLVKLDGLIAWQNGENHDFKVEFSHATGSGFYDLLGERYEVKSPHGFLDFKGWNMSLNLTGYVFNAPLKVNGRVNIKPNLTDYQIQGKAKQFSYSVCGKKMPFEEVNAVVKGSNEQVDFNIQSNCLDGKMTMKGLAKIQQTPNDIQGELTYDQINLQKLLKLYQSSDDQTTGDLTGHFLFKGKADQWKALTGNGVMMVENGSLYAVPILGPLTPLISKLLPKEVAGYNVANTASCTFKVSDGSWITDDLDALTSAFKILVGGKYDFIEDAANFRAQVRVRGLPGILLIPFSELLQYQGVGQLSQTLWTPLLLSGGETKKQ
jgi:hypothetical protein